MSSLSPTFLDTFYDSINKFLFESPQNSRSEESEEIGFLPNSIRNNIQSYESEIEKATFKAYQQRESHISFSSLLTKEIDPNELLKKLITPLQNIIFQNLKINSLNDFSILSSRLQKEMIFETLASYINVKKIPILNLGIDGIDIDKLLRVIGNNLSYLSIEKIPPKIAQRWITFCPNLIHLAVKDLNFKDSDGVPLDPINWFCPLLERSILKVNRLESLSLINCEIGPKEAKGIATLKNLTYLNLRHNKLGGEGVSSLTSKPTALANLVDLNLSRNVFPSWEIIDFAPTLNVFAQLRSFDFSDNMILNSESITALTNGLKKLPNLKELYLEGFLLDNDGARIIAKELPKLTSLNISFNDSIDIDGIKELLQSLKGLLHLDIFNLHLSSRQLDQIIELLIKRPHFCTLVWGCDQQPEEEVLNAAKNRLLEKFPDCIVVFKPRFFSSMLYNQ